MNKLLEKIKNYLKKIRYSKPSEKILLIITSILIIDIMIYSFNYYNNYNEYQIKLQKFNKNEEAVKLDKLIMDNNKTFNSLLNEIKPVEKILIEKDGFNGIASIYIMKDNILIKYSDLFVGSIYNNIEPVLIKEDIPFYWEKHIDKSKYIYKPEFNKPKLIIFNFLKENIIDILLIGIISIIVMQSMPMLSFNKKYELYQPEDIKLDLNDLVGVDPEIKAEINQLKDLIHNQEDYAKYGLGETFHILFAGPPGVGKTVTAISLAKELNVPIILGTGNVETGFVGGGASVIKSLFKEGESLAYANENKTAIIFLDEAQTLLRKRGQQKEKWADDSSNELLAQLEGISSNRDINIVFIAASNFDETNMDLDPAMLRRFKKQIFFRLPDLKERFEILEFYINKLDNSIVSISKEDIKYFSKIFTGFSPAKIETVVKEAGLLSLRKGVKLDKKILQEAYERIVVGYTNRDSSKEDQRERIILHEIGHFITDYHFLKEEYNDIRLVEENIQLIKISSESIAKHSALGYVLNEEDDRLKTKKDFEREIISLYGGYASEEFFYNGLQNVSSGAHNDIEKVTKLLDKMYYELGFYTNSKLNLNLLIDLKDTKNIELISKYLYKNSLDIISTHSELILFLSEKLKEDWVLYKEDLFKYIKEFENSKDT